MEKATKSTGELVMTFHGSNSVQLSIIIEGKAGGLPGLKN